MKIFIALIFLVILSMDAFSIKPEEFPKTRILFVLDGSQSMLTKWETGTKMTVAQRLLTEMVDSLHKKGNIEMALRVYGHQRPVPPQDCNDTKLEVPFEKNNTGKIKDRLAAIRPKGTTPIARSLELAAGDFPPCSDCRNIIILITDGIESCDGDPCAVSLQLQKAGIILKPFVIGVGLNNDFKDTFDCVGRYYDAADEYRFKEVLDVVISQALNTTSAQVNLLDANSRPTESNVNMSFYDNYSGELMYNFMHTINHRGNPDTLKLDPVPTYKVIVHTIPRVSKDSITINPGMHNIIAIDAPQGDLIVKTKANEHRKLQYIVRQKGKAETLNIQKVNQSEKYLTGYYEVEILTVPRLIFEVKIRQSQTTTLQIPKPGQITFTSAAPCYGAIYKQQGSDLVWIQNLAKEITLQTIAMQPGTYTVISRPKNAKESVFTSKKTFKVISGIADKVVLF